MGSPKWVRYFVHMLALLCLTVVCLYLVHAGAGRPASAAAPLNKPGRPASPVGLPGRVAAPFPHPTPTHSPTPTETPACGLVWRNVTVPTSGFYRLQGVKALNQQAAWIVGYYPQGQQLTWRWDGASWIVVQGPSASPYDRLLAVDGAAANDVWAVGSTAGGPLAEHWDGAVWNIIPAPGGSPDYNTFWGVDVVQPGSVWAVGYYGPYGQPDANRTLIDRWDGSQWSMVPSPNVGTGANELYGVSGVSDNDLWAVGTYNTGSDYAAMILHWDGASWSVLPSPGPGLLQGVEAIAADDVWAVGYAPTGVGGAYQPLTLHWNGTAWAAVPVPATGTSGNLTGVSALGSNDVWAVGRSVDASSVERPLSLHWDGASWTAVQVPGLGMESGLLAVDALSPSYAWAVSASSVKLYNDPCPSSGTPTATYTHTGTPSVTPTGARTGTPTGTGTPAPTFTPGGTSTPQAVTVVGHITLQGRPAQPNPAQSVPVSVTLIPVGGGSPHNMEAQTDPSGYFTLTVPLVPGSYSWRVKTAQTLASSGSATLGAGSNSIEVGMLRMGDAGNDNCVSTSDFNIIKQTYGKALGDPGYDPRADFTGDNTVNISDQNLLKINFGTCGAPPLLAVK